MHITGTHHSCGYTWQYHAVQRFYFNRDKVGEKMDGGKYRTNLEEKLLDFAKGLRH